MQQDVLTYLAVHGKVVTDRAQRAFGEVPTGSPLEHTIKSLVDKYLDLIDAVDVEEDITSFKRLIEVYLCEGIESESRECLSQDESGQRVLTIRGYIPPTIEIYRETTSFTPASFRPNGYPGTERWFDLMEGSR